MPENFSPNVQQPPLWKHALSWRYTAALVALALLHGALILFLPLHSPAGFYNSPDEAANARFAHAIKEQGTLVLPLARLDLPGSVVPRGMHRTAQGFIPVGSPSVPLLLGVVAKAVGMSGISWVLAGLSMLGMLAWYYFLRPLFGAPFALTATYLLALHPFVLYWGSRPFMPNAFFLSLLLISLYFLSRVLWTGSSRVVSGDAQVKLEKPFDAARVLRRRFSSGMFGLLLGLAVAVRPQEGLWIGVVLLALFLYRACRRKISWFWCVPAFLFPIAGLLFLQSALYGGVLVTGYALAATNLDFLHRAQALLFPFGFDPPRILKVGYYYFLAMAWWVSALAVVGIWRSYTVKIGHAGARLRMALNIWVALGAWLLLYYGSFEFYDRFDHGLVSIGSSFTRYFLPWYAVSTILAASGILAVRAYLGRTVVAIVLTAVTLLSLHLAFWQGDESILKIAAVLEQNQEIELRVLALIPPEGIILTERSDKIFYPEREVITVFKSPKFDHPRFVELYPFELYYETIADADIVAAENRNFWEPHGLRAIDPVPLGYRHTLYRLTRISP